MRSTFFGAKRGWLETSQIGMPTSHLSTMERIDVRKEERCKLCS